MPGQNTAGRLVELNPDTGAATVVGNDSIPDFNPGTNPPDIQQLTSSAVQGFAWERTGGNNPRYNLWYAVEGARRGPGIDTASSTLYRANDANGSAAVAQGQPWGRRGEIFAVTPGDLGVTTGMAFAGGVLYGVSDRGFFYQISTATGQASNVVSLGQSFSGLTEGPQNLEGGRFQNILFAVTDRWSDLRNRYSHRDSGGRVCSRHLGVHAHIVCWDRLLAARLQSVASDDAATSGCRTRDQRHL